MVEQNGRCCCHKHAQIYFYLLFIYLLFFICVIFIPFVHFFLSLCVRLTVMHHKREQERFLLHRAISAYEINKRMHRYRGIEILWLFIVVVSAEFSCAMAMVQCFGLCCVLDRFVACRISVFSYCLLCSFCSQLLCFENGASSESQYIPKSEGFSVEKYRLWRLQLCTCENQRRFIFLSYLGLILSRLWTLNVWQSMRNGRISFAIWIHIYIYLLYRSTNFRHLKRNNRLGKVDCCQNDSSFVQYFHLSFP